MVRSARGAGNALILRMAEENCGSGAALDRRSRDCWKQHGCTRERCHRAMRAARQFFLWAKSQ
jgi:hypothetical protein